MNESASEYVNESFKYILAILNACFQKEKKKACSYLCLRHIFHCMQVSSGHNCIY